MTLLERPEHEASYDAGAAPRRSSRRRGPVRAAVVVAGLAVLWAVLPATVRLGQDVEPGLPVDAGLLVADFNVDGAYGLHYRHHETVEISVPVRNRGPLPLRIERADLESSPLPLLVQAGDNLPLTVGPWQEAELDLTLRFDNCRHYHERSLDTWDHVALEGSVLGRGFSSTVNLAYPIALHGQIINTCPDRTLTRGDDARPMR